MKRYDKITFISNSNTCRAPMAEALLQDKLILEDVIVDARGLTVLFPEPMNPKAEVILRENGLMPEEYQAKPLIKDDFDDRTLMLTMEEAQKVKILEEYGEDARNVYALTQYCGESGDVVSPFGKDIPEYRECFERIRELVEKLAETVKSEEEGI